MKKSILTLSLILTAFLSGYAQNNNNTNQQATWVIESEGNRAKTQTVKFYDDNAQLIYAETINARLNISKKKVQKALNQILDSLLNEHSYGNNKNVLAASFKLKQ